jgi:hypothetical protein
MHTSLRLPSFTKNILFGLAAAFVLFAVCPQAHAEVSQLSWSDANSSASPMTFVTSITKVIMGVFVLISIIMGSLAFKQLAADGNWKDFWSKIAGSIGMFIVPVVVFYLTKTNANGGGLN